ncbi:MAG: aminotransferase class I/II-fold pyridoxal phosphate-dependent enzyme [Syntrophobacterales bacterium]|jgi:methionine-gamma-lyase|nr:aminotransferase class I/II-fold pyridoxal phosphate-dependent enzyme [Syntrophobacterales bacterium]
MQRKLPPNLHKATQAIYAGQLERPVYGEVSVPIFQTSTFAFPSAEEGAARFSGESPGYIYTRMGNPTVHALEDNLAALENGSAALATATGMAAITTVFLSLLSQGDHLVAEHCLYGPTEVVIEAEMPRFGIEATLVDTSNLSAIEPALRPNTRMIYLETPTNPTMKITDIRGAAAIAHRHGAWLTVDNTFCSPYVQRPLDLGADLVIHSLTKYLNGHSDVVGGMIVVKDAELYRRLKRVLTLFGATMDPHQAWLILRGVRTLPLRMERSQDNALKLAEFLSRHPKVTWVRHPGLPDHPQHGLAQAQMDGFGAMLCFGVQGGLEGAKTVINRMRLITRAVSLGGVESLIEHPASMTHAGVPREKRERAGIGDELVRLSVGCEDVRDLQADLDQALNKIP